MTQIRTIDVGVVLADARLTATPILVVVLSFLVIMLDGYDLLCMAFVAPSLSKELNLEVASFGPIFTAAFVGIMVGGLAISPFGDRFGRKIILVSSVALFGFFSLMPIFDFSYSHLIIYRLMTGVGLGGAMPGAVALTSEYAPRRFKGLFVNLMFAGVAAGAVVGGLLASKLIPLYGWQSAFWIGGVSPLALAAVLAVFMPESISYLALSKGRADYIAGLLRKIAPAGGYTATDTFVLNEEARGVGRIGSLFTEGRAYGTLLLWVIAFTALFANGLLASWLPAIMVKQGLPLQTGILAPVMMNLGGILGTVLLGALFSRVGATSIIAGGLLLTSLGTYATGQAIVAGGPVLPAVFFAGTFLLGSMNSTNTLMAAFYPTRLRSTGVGWALGMGRIGGALGPAIGGIMLGMGRDAGTIMLVTALVTALGVLASLVMGVLYVAHRRAGDAAARQPVLAH